MRSWLAVTVALVGCDPLSDDTCAGGFHPVDGSPDQFTAGPLEAPGVWVSAPVPCSPWEGAEGEAVEVQAEGVVEEAGWFTDRLLPELEARGITSYGWGMPSCGDDGLAIVVLDWALADPIVETTVELVQEDDVTLHLWLEVVPQPIACADAGRTERERR